MEKELTKTELFIKKAKAIHGDKYNYDKTVYVKSLQKVIITCPVHGDFEQFPNNHILKKCGCYACSGRNIKPVNKRALTTSSFIEKSKKVHGDKYNYDKTDYSHSHIKVILTCPKHGDFLVSPNNHLRNEKEGGCPKCHYGVPSNNEVIENFKKVHGNKYNYDKTVYENSCSKVIITCSIHGDFEQLARSHLKGHGCKKCSYMYSKKYCLCPIHGQFPKTKYNIKHGCPSCNILNNCDCEECKKGV